MGTKKGTDSPQSNSHHSAQQFLRRLPKLDNEVIMFDTPVEFEWKGDLMNPKNSKVIAKTLINGDFAVDVHMTSFSSVFSEESGQDQF